MSDWEPANMWEDYDQEFDQPEGDVEFVGIVQHETDKAYLIRLTNEEKTEIWIPKSQVGDIDGELDPEGEMYQGEPYTFTIPAWLAEKKGI